MPVAVQMTACRVKFARFSAESAGAATPAALAKLLTVEIGDGNTAEFQDPTSPPPVDPDDTALRGALLGSKNNPTITYLVPAPGTGALVYDGEAYDISASPTRLALFTWLFGVADAVGQWREILWRWSGDNAVGWKLHPIGTPGVWQTKTNAEQRPVKFLLEY